MSGTGNLLCRLLLRLLAPGQEQALLTRQGVRPAPRAAVRAEIELAELLGRPAVNLDTPELQRFLAGKRILITGAGGSIGSEICRQMMRFCPQRVILVERTENNLFEIDRELRERWVGAEIRPCIADICDARRITEIFQAEKPHVVFHCAAHKHVPMMEHNPCEAIKNNVFGTKTVADAAIAAGTSAFVLISTDKAVNPSSVMGATKRVAELYLQSLNYDSNADRSEAQVAALDAGLLSSSLAPVLGGEGRVRGGTSSRAEFRDSFTLGPSPQPSPPSTGEREQEINREHSRVETDNARKETSNPKTAGASSLRFSPLQLTIHEPAAAASRPTARSAGSTRFVAVRFGNVLGSSGSVVPIFQKQIEAGGPVTVTHPDMQRYFMTIPEASQLVMQAGAIGRGGEVMLLDMGSPVKIVDMARQLIRRNGLTPDDDIQISFTGVRPGEKLYEELSCNNEKTRPTSHQKIRAWQLAPVSPRQAAEYLRILAGAVNGSSRDAIEALARCVPEFRSQDRSMAAEVTAEQNPQAAIVEAA